MSVVPLGSIGSFLDFSWVASTIIYLSQQIFLLPEVECNLPSSQTTALRNSYHSTNGPKWFDNRGWLDGDPCLTGWVGVYCNKGLRGVEKLVLESNNLDGTLPDLSSLVSLAVIHLDKNHLRGPIPDNWGSFPAMKESYLKRK